MSGASLSETMALKAVLVTLAARYAAQGNSPRDAQERLDAIEKQASEIIAGMQGRGTSEDMEAERRQAAAIIRELFSVVSFG